MLPIVKFAKDLLETKEVIDYCNCLNRKWNYILDTYTDGSLSYDVKVRVLGQYYNRFLEELKNYELNGIKLVWVEPSSYEKSGKRLESLIWRFDWEDETRHSVFLAKNENGWFTTHRDILGRVDYKHHIYKSKLCTEDKRLFYSDVYTAI